jgi:hypothetical protein
MKQVICINGEKHGKGDDKETETKCWGSGEFAGEYIQTRFATPNYVKT